MVRILKLAAVSLAAAATLAPTPASAQFWDSGRRAPYSARGYGRAYDHPDVRQGDGGRAAYTRRHSHCDKGTGGTLLGAIAGGLLGNAAVGRRGDRTAGTVAGAGVGALLGRAADRDC
jgi:hypothetical protein